MAKKEKHMTVLMVEAQVQRIRDLASNDCEAAHGAEDLLYAAVLTYIANYSSDAQAAALARAALVARDIEFKRHCA